MEKKEENKLCHYSGLPSPLIYVDEPKQETLEQAAKTYRKTIPNSTFGDELGFIDGAKWQQERMYSEEEVLDILYKHTEDLLAGKKIMLDDWFEQFKKK
jgi:hypothetical protein